MILRLRTPAGQQRLELQPEEPITKLYELIESKYSSVQVWKGDTRISKSSDRIDIVFKHGDIVTIKGSAAVSVQQPAATLNKQYKYVQHSKVDTILLKEKGLIPRSKSRFCNHGANAMCEYCSPMEPYDASYQKSQNIKHLSFHAYLRSLVHSNKCPPVTSDMFIPPLTNPEFKLADCKNHEPYPKGICSKCQPSSVTLSPQVFRMTDHVELPHLDVNEFISYWRQTGQQRFGLLLGRYEVYDGVPLGVKASVVSVYELQQVSGFDYIHLHTLPTQENEELKRVEMVARELGLEIVGYDHDTKSGVVHKRHEDSYFISGPELELMAGWQHRYPVPTQYCDSGKFGSRFFTLVITGNEKGEIEITGYQLSIAGEALLHSNMIESCAKPSLMRVTQSDEYQPELFYMAKNEYGIELKTKANPTFPIEYLITTVTHGFPTDSVEKGEPAVCIENRKSRTDQDLIRILSTMQLQDVGIHTLCWIAESGFLNVQEVLGIVKSGDVQGFEELKGRFAHTVQDSATWQCKYCTFMNGGGDECQICGLPK